MSSSQKKSWLASIIGRYWPAHIKNPFGLIYRILTSGDRAALYTLMAFGLTILAIPLDIVMSFFERKRLENTSPRKHPIIFICGPARSGTTITHQLLVGTLPLAYVSNLTAVFPRSPLTAYRWFKRFRTPPAVGTQSFYGKTASMSGPNDADHIWNRWVGLDEGLNRTVLTEEAGKSSAEFFRAFENCEQKPIVCKNNKLLAFASHIDKYVDNAWYICLSRDPVYLAQSQIIAATALVGDATAGYGLSDTSEDKVADNDDAVNNSVNRVNYNRALIESQREKIGERFWVVNYEDVCDSPEQLVARVAKEILEIDLSDAELKERVPKLANGNRVKLPQAEFDRLKTHFEADTNSA